MACFFFDSSAVVKRYLSETGSQWVRAILDPTVAHDIFLVKITGVEAVSAFVRQSPALPPAVLVQILTEFKYDMQVQYQLLNVTDALLTRATGLVETHRLRGYDAVQLAAALELATVSSAITPATMTFVCADVRLNSAAQAEGLAVDDPNSHP
ncbi:MAG: type II toxin-antitoxin system VapC family toxin [Planctomycetia bacterium]|nr:type II toxin-antitoxin system VapC family toxin [Planctomycetia bacterium]